MMDIEFVHIVEITYLKQEIPGVDIVQNYVRKNTKRVILLMPVIFEAKK